MHETESKMTKVTDSPKNRGAMIGGAITALLVAGGFAAIALSGQNAERGAQKDGAPAVLLAQMDDPGLGGGPGMPPTGAPGVPTAPATTQNDKQALKGTSFSRMPDAYGGAAAGGGATSPFGAPAGFGPPGAGAGATTTPPNWDALDRHIKRGKTAPSARPDPFVSYRFPGVQKLPAYLYLAPIRMAKRPDPPVPPVSADPDLQYGPLPFVPRRVAGILYNGVVSAILEIGNPGTGAEVFIVRPGDKVPSGIAGLDELTVTSISPTQLILRAEDGRTTTVALSGAPELQGQITPGAGGGFPGGGRPGGPPAGGGPGGAASQADF